MFTFLICPTCNGTGQLEGKSCGECQGIGLGAWHEGRFIYWGRILDKKHILQRKIRRFINTMINFFLVLFGIFGAGILVWAFWKNDLENLFGLSFALPKFYKIFPFHFVHDQDSWFFWGMRPQILFTVFWFSLLTDLYLIFRIKNGSLRNFSLNKSRKFFNFLLNKHLTEFAANISKGTDISQVFSSKSLWAIEEVYKSSRGAGKFSYFEILPIHLFISLLQVSEIKIIFARLGIGTRVLEEKARSVLLRNVSRRKVHSDVSKWTKTDVSPAFRQEIRADLKVGATGELQKIFLKAYLQTREQNLKRVQAEDLLATIAEEGIVKEILYQYKIDQRKLKNVTAWIRINRALREQWQEFRGLARFKPKGVMNRAMTAIATPFLDQFSEDLTLLAKLGYLSLCVNRERELEEIFRILESRGRGVVLSGESGVGKNAIIEGLAQLMVEEKVPKMLQDKKLIKLSIAQIVAGVTPAEAEERFLRICYEISRARNIVLYIPDIHQAVGVQGKGVDLSDVMAEEIKKGYFSCLTSTTPLSYSRLIELSSLNSALQKININEPEIDLAIQILEAKIGYLEYQNKVFFSYDALEKAVELSKKFLHDYYLPEKAIEVAEETAHYVSRSSSRTLTRQKAIVTGEDIAEIISHKTKIPLASIKEEEREKLLRLEEVIHQRIIDQEEAVSAVSEVLRQAKLELRTVEKPIANFLFLGPTGVGKTETAKTVAEVFFSGQKGMIRLDMSEFQEKASVSRLLGSSGQGGLLTEPVRKNPFSLLLLDEIEKAHPDILNIFLAVMDDGRATDGAGRVIDFTNIIIIATSNAGSSFIQEELRKGLSIEQIKDRLLQEEIKIYFKPEFLNRLDGIIVFKPLGLNEIEQIAHLLIKREAKRVEERYGIDLKVTDGAMKELSQAGFDPTFGARPLKRVIRRRIDDILAHLLLEKKLERRDAVIFDKGGEVKIEKAREL